MSLILTDIDDTVLDFAEAFTRFMRANGYEPKTGLRSTRDVSRAFQISIPETTEAVNAFLHAKAFEEIEPAACALAVLPALHRAGHRFVAITALPWTRSIVARRQRNLREAFGFAFEAVHCSGLATSKAPYLSAYAPAVWVEDAPHHASEGAECGHRAFLLDRPHNAHHADPAVVRVRDWHAVGAALVS